MFICENVVALHYQMLLPLHICQHKRLIQLDYDLGVSPPERFGLLTEVRHDGFSEVLHNFEKAWSPLSKKADMPHLLLRVLR